MKYGAQILLRLILYTFSLKTLAKITYLPLGGSHQKGKSRLKHNAPQYTSECRPIHLHGRPPVIELLLAYKRLHSAS